jgi:DNA-binding IclR family transcriptional regulator
MSKRATSPRTATRRGIQSVETGLRVLAALAASGGPAPLTALGVRAGLSPSQTHRYLQSLVVSGMAVQDAASRYDLGPGVIRIGIAALSRLNAFSRAEAAMQSFVEETGRTGLLSVWGEAGAVCVRWFPGRPVVLAANIGLGAVMPLLYSATGRVFLTFLSPPELEGPLAAACADSRALPDLETIRSAVRRTLTADSDETMFAGLRTMAAPIFDMQGRAAAVATAIATDGIPRSQDAAVAERLRAACRDATIEAGGAWPA